MALSAASRSGASREAITEVGQTQEELDNAVIRIHPERIISFGIVISDQEPQEMTAHNRDVARR